MGSFHAYAVVLKNLRDVSKIHAYVMYAPYDEHHKVSSFLNSHKNTHNSVKYGTLQRSKLGDLPGLEIVTNTVANATSFFSLATKLV